MSAKILSLFCSFVCIARPQAHVCAVILSEISHHDLPLLPDEVAIGAGGNVVTGGGVEPNKKHITHVRLICPKCIIIARFQWRPEVSQFSRASEG